MIKRPKKEAPPVNPKFAVARKKLITESAIVLGMAALLGGGAYFLSTVSDDYEKKNKELEAEISKLQNETAGLQSKYDKVQKHIALSLEAGSRLENGDLSLNRQRFKEQLNSFKNAYHLANLHVSIGATEEMKDAKFKSKAYALIGSEVTLTFDAPSDEYIYQLINEVVNGLSGSVKILKLTMDKQTGLSDSALQSMASSGEATLIKTTLKFNWIGMKAVDQAAAPGGPGVPPGGAPTGMPAAPPGQAVKAEP